MSSNDDWLFDPKSNRFIKTYLRGYLDISGGDVILRNNNIYVKDGDISLNGNLLVNNDASFNSKMFVAKDVCMNELLLLGNDASFNSKLFVAGDVCMNQLLFVGNDVSLNSKLFVAGDVCMNELLFVGNDVSLNSKLFVAGDVSINETLHVGNDVIMDSKLLVQDDASFNSNVTISGDLIIRGTLGVYQYQDVKVINTTVNNYELIVSEDISLNGRLFASDDVSFNSKLFVAGDVSMNSSLTVTDDVNFNSNLFVAGDSSLNNYLDVAKDIRLRNLFARGTAEIMSTLDVSKGVVFGSTLNVSGPAYFASSLDVSSNTNLGSNLTVSGDVSMNSMLSIGKNVYINNTLTVSGDVSMNSTLIVSGDVSMNSHVFANTLTVSGDVSMNSKLFVNDNITLLNGAISANDIIFDVSNVPIELTGNFANNQMSVYSQFQGSERIFNGQYDVSASSFTSGYEPWKMFTDHLGALSSAHWRSRAAYTNGIPNVNAPVTTYTSLSGSLNSISGEYVNITFPFNIQINDISIACNNFDENITPGILKFVALGYVNDDWIELVTYSVNDTLSIQSTIRTIDIPTHTLYTNSIRIVINQIRNSSNYAVISELGFSGDVMGSKVVFGNGNIGIGTTNPRSALEVTGDILISNASTGRNLTGSNVEHGRIMWSGIEPDININPSTYIRSYFEDNTHDTSGNLAFGTSAGSTGAIDRFVIHATGENEFISDVSINTRLMVNGDVSLNSNLYVKKVGEFDSILAVKGDVSMNSKLTVFGDASFNSNLYVAKDVSMNSKLTVFGDASFNSNLYVAKDVSMNSKLTVSGDVSLNSKLRVSGDVSLNSKLTVSGDGLMNSKLTVTGDGLMNSKLRVIGDVSLNSKLTVTGNALLNSTLYVAKDVSMNSKLTVTGDASFNSNLYVAKDVSMNSKLTVSGDGLMNSKLTVTGNALLNSTLYVAKDVSMNSKLTVTGDGLMNSKLRVSGDVSLNSKLTVTGDGLMNSKLNVIGEGSFNSNLYVTKDVSFNSKLNVIGEGLFNSNLYVTKDVSMNSKLNVSGDVSLNSKLTVGGDVSLNSKLSVGGDVSLNSKLAVEGDVSFNSNLYVAGDVLMRKLFVGNNNQNEEVIRVYGKIAAYEFQNLSSTNEGPTQITSSYAASVIFGNIDSNNSPTIGYGTINTDLVLKTNNAERILLKSTGETLFYNDVSMNSKLFIVDDVSMHARLHVGRDVSMNSRLQVGGDIRMNSNLFLDGDASFNSKLFVGGDVSMDSRLHVDGDVSMNSRLQVDGDVSMNSRLQVIGDAIINSNLFVLDDVSFNSNLYVNKDVKVNSKLFIVDDVSMHARLHVGRDVSMNSRLQVGGDIRMNSNLFLDGDASFNSNLYVNKDVTIKSNLFVTDDVSFNSNLTVSGDLIVFGKLDVNEIQNTKTTNTTVNDYTLIVSEDLSLNGNMSVSGNANISGRIVVQKDGDVIIQNKNLVIGDSVYLSTIVASSIFSDITNPSESMSKTFLSNNDTYTVSSSSYNTALGSFSVASAFVNNLSTWKSSVMVNQPTKTYRTISSDEKQLIYAGDFSTTYYNPNNNASFTLNGEWIELDLPYAAIVDTYEIRTDNFQCPSFGVLLGYDYTNTRWQLIHIYDNTLPTSINDKLFQFSTMLSSIETKTYRFVINQINRSSNAYLTTSPDLDGNISIIYDHNASIRYINFSGNIKNTGISIGAGYSQNTANTSMGFGTLAGNKDGKNNIAIGNYTLSQTRTSDNIAIGYNALVNNQLGFQNVVIGTDSQVNNTAGSQNVTLGHQSGYFNTGIGNTFIGHQSGYNNRDGSYNTYIGFNAGGGINSNFTNSTAIGANAIITANNQIVIGTANNNVRIPGTIQLLGGLVGDVSFNEKLFVNKDVQLNSTLRVARNAIITGRLDGNGNLNIQNQLTANNTTTSVQELVVRGSTFLQSTTSEFTANGPSNIKNTLNVDRVTTLNSTLMVTKTTTLNSTLMVTKSANIGSRLNVTGDVSFNSNLTVQNNVNILQNLTIGANTRLNTLTTIGNTDIYGSFTTYNSVKFASIDSTNAQDKLNINTGPNSNKTTTIRNNVVNIHDDETTIPFIQITGRKMTINGSSTAATALDVIGVIESNFVRLKSGGTIQADTAAETTTTAFSIGDAFNGMVLQSFASNPPRGLSILPRINEITVPNSSIDIDVSGNMRIKQLLAIDGSFNVGGTASINRLQVISDTSLNGLYVAGNTLLDTLVINGPATMNSTLDVSGATTMSSTLSVSNAATMNSTLDVSGATTLNQSLNVIGTTTLNDSLSVYGNTMLSSNLDVCGNITAINSDFTINNILVDVSNIPAAITGNFKGDDIKLYSRYYGSESVFNGTYDISASSSQTGHAAWNVFDVSDTAWYSENNYSNTVPSILSSKTTYYNSSDVSFSLAGEYIDIKFPFNLKLTKMNIRCDDFNATINSSISKFNILYKTDDDRWKQYYNYVSPLNSEGVRLDIKHGSVEEIDTIINISYPGLYSNNYRIVFTEIGSGTNYAVVSKLSFDGDILGSKVNIGDGNIGIGSILPRSALEVAGDITISNAPSGENTSGTEVEHGRIVWGGTNRDISHNNHSSYIRSYFKNETFDTSGNLAFGTSDGIGVAKDKFIIHSNGVSEFMTDVSINGNLSISENLDVNTLSIDSNLFVNGKIGMNNSNPLVTLDISGTDAIRIPVGSTSSRPTNSLRQTEYYGSIRYNTTNSQFEGYGPGGAWGSLGGVINVSQNTKILAAEPTPDSSNNQLTFYTNNALRMIIESSGDVSMNYKLKVDGDASFNSALSIGGKTTLHRDVSMNANVGISGDLIILGDASFNSTLSIGGKTTLHRDVSMNANVGISGGLIILGDASFNSTLSIGGKTTLHRDVSMNANVGISGGLIILGDASFNSTLSIGGKTTLHRDVSMNANVGISGDLIIKGNLSVFQTKQTETINTTINDYTLIVTEDISLNGSLRTSKDISVNSLTVGRGSGNIATNTAIGYQALSANTIGVRNVANGYHALYSNTTSTDNVAVGYQAGYNNTTGLKNTFIGATTNISPTAATWTNSTAIGFGALITESFQIVLGRSSETVKVPGKVEATSYNATSDYRIKKDVVPISDTSYNVDKLRPVTYTNTISNKQDIGLIAHELQEEFPFLVTGEKDGEPNQTVNYTGLIGVLINEIQQLKQRVNELERSRP